uniref:Uncharacterized protein n=1 Tax=Arundo donax TaxID=35708 RepID=A0A0A9BU29_ARUDO
MLEISHKNIIQPTIWPLCNLIINSHDKINMIKKLTPKVKIIGH